MKILNPTQKQRTLNALMATVEQLRQTPAYEDCRQCLHFDTESGMCDAYETNQPVPEWFYLKDCPKWEEEIPF